jgi:hypothetical protein
VKLTPRWSDSRKTVSGETGAVHPYFDLRLEEFGVAVQ